jgi:UPF0755 protein
MSDDNLSNGPESEPEGKAYPAEPAAADAERRRRPVNPKSPRQAIQPETAAPPPQRSRHAKHPVVFVLNAIMMLGVLGVLFLGAVLYFGKLQFNAKGPLTETRSVLISPGASLESISAQLERRDVIDSRLFFSTAVRVYKAEDKLKAGEYLFEPGVSMHEVMTALVSGRSILHAVTIPEGLTSYQIVARLVENDVLTGEIGEIPEEGTLLPETYKFTRGMTRQQILDQMRKAQQRAVQEIWNRRVPDLPIETPEQFVTLASIVEKETGKADERPRVASVFINRLRQSIRLQSDPTIIYGIFGGEGKPPDRPIYRSDLDKPTAYNTYKIDGLPPGPIANPGRAALEAVANPSRTNDLYFVADGTGGHVFAETLDEHNRNVARWRQIEKARREAAEAAARQAAEEEAAGDSAPEEGAPDEEGSGQ